MKRRFGLYTIMVLLLLLFIVPIAMLRARQMAIQGTPPSDNAALAATNEPMEKQVFQSPLAGRWYDADAAKVTAEIDGYLSKADEPLLDHVQAIIVPHAGYRYSGQVAAYSYKQIAGKKYSRVIVMGPSHRLPMEDVASVPSATHYATILGEVPLDTAFIDALKKHPEFRTLRGADEDEHSVQIQIPFLQRALGDFTLVPIVVGQLSPTATRTIANILLGLIDANTLVVASSDFTHYGPNYGYQPFKDNVEENLKKLDAGAWACIEKKDLDGFTRYVEETHDTICGRCPIGVLLAMLPADSQPHQLRYDTSGHLTGDTTNSVSYYAIAFTGAWPNAKPVEAKAEPAPGEAALTDEDKAQLLTLARATLEYGLKNNRMPKPDEFGIKITPAMSKIMGAFVTLNEHGDLRGCIGDIFASRPLYKAVMENAINAGIHDPRFPPVTLADLPLLHFELSALTEPAPIESYKDIVLGKHGILLEKYGRRAVFLPQVPPEQGWNLQETLTHLAMKAGLQADDWRQGAKYQVFEAIVFGEKKE